MGYRTSRSYDNLERRIFDGVGEYDIPEISPVTYEGGCDWIGFNYAKSCKNPSEKGVHFFLDDYQFCRLWSNIDRYIPMLQRFRYVMSPDFSTYTDFPKVMQIYNHYRKHWCAAYMQEAGIQVIPTISWSTPDSYNWCFDGEPEGGTVAVSSVGCMNGKKKKELFLSGYNAMIEKLHPESIIFYGKMPEECKGNIVRIKSFSDRFSKAICEG